MTKASDIGGVEKFAPKGFFLSHRGKVREANEDSILCDKIYSKDDCSESLAFDFSDKNQWVIALADGMGGAAAGDPPTGHSSGSDGGAVIQSVDGDVTSASEHALAELQEDVGVGGHPGGPISGDGRHQ